MRYYAGEGLRPAIASLGGQPALAYETSEGCKFSWLKQPGKNRPPVWVTSLVPGASAYDSRLVVIGDRPVIVHQAHDGVAFTQAVRTRPSSPQDWKSYTVGGSWREWRFALIDSKPAFIARYMGMIFYLQAGKPLPQSPADWRMLAIGGTMNIEQLLSLAGCGKTPVAAVRGVDGNLYLMWPEGGKWQDRASWRHYQVPGVSPDNAALLAQGERISLFCNALSMPQQEKVVCFSGKP